MYVCNRATFKAKLWLKQDFIFFSLSSVFHENYTSSKSAGYQILALIITLVISILSGAVTGELMMMMSN